jgi:putative ABC transport system permease protein
VLSASWHKSVRDLTGRRARAAFTVTTLALAVASISFLAIPTLIDRAMQDEVRDGRLADVTLALRPVELTDDQLDDIAALPNVAAVEATSSIDVRVLIGERRAPARVVGVRDFAAQEVDVVRIDSGALAGDGELVADVQNTNVGLYDGQAGDEVTVLSGTGEDRTLPLTGRARSLPGGEHVQDNNVIVLYATASTVAELSGEAGVDRLALRLDDPSPDAAEATVEAVRTHLASVPGFNGFANLPQVRAPGDWPGKADTEAFARFLSALTVLALLSAVVLISSTMSTLVAEQTREIGIMRAIGARRRQVAAVYLRTTLLLGGIAALVGAALGILLSSLLARYFGSLFWVVDVGFGVDPTVLAISLLVGLLAPALAALPAIRRGLRVDLRDALEASGSTFGGQGAADRALRRAGFLPRTMQIGLRNVGRRKRRSLATALIVALAVGNLLAVLGVAAAATEASRRSWSSHLEDLQLSTSGRDLFDAEAERAIRATPGVAEAEPVLKNTVVLNGQEAFVWGVEQEPLLDYRLADGRWFTRAEEDNEELVAVVERNIAQLLAIEVDDDVSIQSAAGTADFRVVGLADNQQEDGTAVYIPLTTARALIGLPEGANAYWVRADSSDPAVVDRTTTQLEDRLAALGYEVDSEVSYVAERDEVAANRSLTTTIGLLGFVIVAMSMVGLANAITTNVLERTREIGIVRCIGARARDVRRIFTTEGVAIAVAGWVIGIPLGYAFDRLLVRLIWEVADVRIPVLFPPANVLVALVGTVVLSLVVLHLPVRRAVRFRPGDALRYA